MTFHLIQQKVQGLRRDLGDLGEKFIKYIVSPGSKCVQCHSEVISPDPDRVFCSPRCELAFNEEFKSVYRDESGEVPLCSFPNCLEPCYVEDHGHIHDYCSKSHAMEHEKRKAVFGRQSTHRANSQEKSSRGRGRGRTCGRGVERQQDNYYYQQNAGAMYNTRNFSYWNGPIYFYNRGEPYYEFTNFFTGAEIKLDGVLWPTTEHYFQAQKFVGTPFVDKIRNSPFPRDAFSLSRDSVISYWKRSDWEDVKMDIMRKALYAKFTQHSFLKRKLIETEDRVLVERSPHDSFWGDGGNGTGQNHLGKLLMELRTKLQSDDIERDNVPVSEKKPNSKNKSITTCTCISSECRSNESHNTQKKIPSDDQLKRRPLNEEADKESLLDSDVPSQCQSTSDILKPISVVNKTQTKSDADQGNEDDSVEGMDYELSTI